MLDRGYVFCEEMHESNLMSVLTSSLCHNTWKVKSSGTRFKLLFHLLNGIRK
jgi:hypothetical protein